ncbi:MAG: hypothetical protein ABSA85_17855, partial [Terracidiphilus sp.]
VYLNNPLDPRNLTNPTSLVLNSAGTGCSAASLLNTSGNFPITGSVQSTQTSSFFQLAALDPNHTSNQYVSASTGYDSSYASTPNPGSYGCTQANLQNLSSLRTIPSIDAYGYPLGPNMETGTAGYKYSYYLNAVASQAPVIWDNKTEWGGDPTSPQPITQKLPAESAAAYQWTLADWDDVDNIASAIRSDAHYAARGDSAPMVISIMTVGYTGDGGTDAGLLSKIANVSGCSIKNPYNVTLNCVVTTGANGTKEQNGVFIPASNTTELNDAFSTLMSTILRLSQ